MPQEDSARSFVSGETVRRRRRAAALLGKKKRHHQWLLGIAGAAMLFGAPIVFAALRRCLRRSFDFRAVAAFGETTLVDFAFLDQVLKVGWQIQVIGHCEFLSRRKATALAGKRLYL